MSREPTPRTETARRAPAAAGERREEERAGRRAAERAERDARWTRAARLALYGSLGLTLLMTAILYATLVRRTHIEDDDTDYASMPSVIDLQGLVRIDTTADRGSELEGARYLAGLLAAEGIEAEIEELPGGKANLFAVLDGRSPELLVLHSHLDTDPIHRPDAWVEDPFGGTLRGPFIYGRGVFDMKSTTIAQLHAFVAAHHRAREEGPPARSLALLATSSEETDSLLGTQRVLEQRPAFSERIWVVLTEGGVVEALDWDAIKHWGTSFAQKRYAPVRYYGPRREELEQLREALRTGAIGRRHGPPRWNAAAATFLESYRHTRQHPDIREPLGDLEALLADPALFERQPDFIKALFRNELHGFEVRPAAPASAGSEPRGEAWVLPLLLHLPPGATLEQAVAELLPTEQETPRLRREIEPPIGSGEASPVDHPAFVAIQEQIRATHGDVPRGPFFLAFYANDCRFFRAASKVCYGFQPFLLPGSDSATTAGPDERIALRGYVQGVELYVELVERLLALPAPPK